MTLDRKRLKRLRGERGSALTEAAIIIPVLILVIYWSSAMTDVMVLKIKAQEATRFALWEMTVFRSTTDINADVQNRFADLKSPASVISGTTGLIMYPKSADIGWQTTIVPNERAVTFGGRNQLPTTGQGFIDNAANALLNLLSSTVDGAVQREQFNTGGSATARVQLTHATHSGSIIMNGGDLAGSNSGGKDLGAPPILQDLSFETPLGPERPMRLVYDSWKAWPKPAAYTTTTGTPASLKDPSASPAYSYPVVESMVSNQVSKITFFGLTRYGWFQSLNNALGSFMSNGLVQSLVGGDAPTWFATGPMDHSLSDISSQGIPGSRGFSPGPITILPVGKPDVGWVPGNGLYTNRLGDLGSSGTNVSSNDDLNGMGAGADQSRYTVPYRINTKYWTGNGGTKGSTFGSSVSPAPAAIATNNKYVAVYGCRGHYFAGATKPQITDRTKRYTAACPN